MWMCVGLLVFLAPLHFFFFLQLIRLWLQVCEEKEAPEKEMLARGSSPDPRVPPRGQDPRGH